MGTLQAETAGREVTTKQKILDVAERLFVSDGFSEASMRRITKEAGASLGAVNYHFGSKEGLFEAVVERQFGPLLMERVTRLQELEKGVRPDDADYVLQLLQSWLDPLVNHLASNPNHIKIIYAIDQVLSARAPSIFQAVSPYHAYLTRFGKVLQQALPDLTLETAFWRFHFMIGAVTLALSANEFVAASSEGLCVPTDFPRFRRELLRASMLIFGISAEEGERAITASNGSLAEQRP